MRIVRFDLYPIIVFHVVRLKYESRYILFHKLFDIEKQTTHGYLYLPLQEQHARHTPLFGRLTKFRGASYILRTVDSA